MKKYIFPILVALSALSLAGAAAFFSVTGLSKLFGGAKMEVIIMASALELAKLVTASFLHRYWNTLKWHMKTYLTIGVMTVMLITSAGIYGFLSNAYSTTSGKLQNIDAQIQMVDQKKVILTSEITRKEEKIKSEGVEYLSLVTIIKQLETRVDSFNNRRQVASAKRVESQIEQHSKKINIIKVEIDTLDNQIQKKHTEISVLDMDILNLKNSDVNGEVGPLKYIAKLTGKDMDSVVNFFIMLLIFVFDPLAVSLVIATNISIQKEFGEKEKPKLKPESVNDAVSEPINDGVIEGAEVKPWDIRADDTRVERELMIDETKRPLPNEFEERRKFIDTIFSNKEEQDEAKKNEAEVIQYISDESGEFKPVPKESTIVSKEHKAMLDHIQSQGIGHNASYLNYLDVLFKNGKVGVGELIVPYNKFLEEIKANGFNCTVKEVKDFLTICNLFKITDMSGPDKKIAKEYAVAKSIISLLSK